MKTYSFYNKNINKELVRVQKEVFNKLGWEIKQVKSELTHSELLDNTIKGISQNEIIVFFDIDCIPLFDFRHIIESICVNEIFANVQRSSHIKGSKDYAAPSFFCITGELYNDLGKPSFKPSESGDVAEDLSRNAPKSLLYPIHVETPMWSLDNGQMIGYGTTYGQNGDPFTYHAFESNANHDSTKKFIDKCHNLLK